MICHLLGPIAPIVIPSNFLTSLDEVPKIS